MEAHMPVGRCPANEAMRGVCSCESGEGPKGGLWSGLRPTSSHLTIWCQSGATVPTRPDDGRGWSARLTVWNSLGE